MARTILLCLVALSIPVFACSSDVDDASTSQSASGTGAGGASSSSGSGAEGGSGAQGGSGGESFGACSLSAQCILATPGCCGTCGAPTVETVAAIRADEAQAYFDATCPDPENTPCPGCASFTNGNLYAYCDAGQCTAADISKNQFSECTQASDCALRWGSGCCPGCTGAWEPSYGGDLIAVSTAQLDELVGLLCEGGDILCDDCAPQFPPTAIADCQAGHCVVVEGLTGGG